MNHSSQSKPAVRAKIIKVKALCEHAALLPSAALLRSRGRLSASNNTAAGAVCQVFFTDSVLESKLSGRFAGFGGRAPQKTADHACGRAVTPFPRAFPKNTRPFAKTPFGRFCSCGRAVTASPRKRLYQPRHSQKLSLWSRFCSCGRAVTPFPHTRTQTKNRLPSSKASFRAGDRFCLCVVGEGSYSSLTKFCTQTPFFTSA